MGSYRTYSSLVKLQHWFLSLQWPVFEQNCNLGAWVCSERPALGHNSDDDDDGCYIYMRFWGISTSEVISGHKEWFLTNMMVGPRFSWNLSYRRGKTSPRKLVPTGGSKPVRCVTGAHATAYSLAVDISRLITVQNLKRKLDLDCFIDNMWRMR